MDLLYYIPYDNHDNKGFHVTQSYLQQKTDFVSVLCWFYKSTIVDHKQQSPACTHTQRTESYSDPTWRLGKYNEQKLWSDSIFLLSKITY